MKKIACVMLAAVFLSCTGNHREDLDLRTVKVDFSELEHISQSDGRIVHLETTDSSLLYDICRLDVHEDTFVVQSRSFLYTFASTGKFIGPISQKGHAGNEYLQISNVFFDDGVVGIYDFNRKALSRFNLEGRLLSVQKCDIADDGVCPFHIYPWNDGYIALNTYGGESADRKALCFLNKELTSGKSIEGRSLSTGFSTYDDMFIDANGDLLYWELLCDTLFAIDNGRLKPLLAIDFGEHALPYNVTGKDVYERVEYADKLEEHGKKLAGMARYYQRIGNKIYFSCLSPDNGILLCQYNEASGTSRLFTVDFGHRQYVTGTFFLIKDNMLYWEVRDEADLSLNPGLFVLHLDDWA